MSYYNFSEENDPVKEDEYFMRIALQEAEKAFALEEIPIGAIVVCKGRIVGRGYNLTEQLNDVTAHAEMQAFTAASQTLGGKYLKECTLYVTIEPCVMCAGASYWFQVGRVVFGAYDARMGFGRLNQKITHPKTIIAGGIRENECAELIKDFFRKKR